MWTRGCHFSQQFFPVPSWLRYEPVEHVHQQVAEDFTMMLRSTTDTMDFAIIQREALTYLWARGSWPTFVVHGPGMVQPASFTPRELEHWDETDLILAIRCCFQDILPDQWAFMRYVVDPQPAPSQQGGVDDLHLILIDHPPSQLSLPSLVALDFGGRAATSTLKAIESPEAITRQQILMLVGLPGLQWDPRSCRMMLEGAFLISDGPLRSQWMAED